MTDPGYGYHRYDDARGGGYDDRARYDHYSAEHRGGYRDDYYDDGRGGYYGDEDYGRDSRDAARSDGPVRENAQISGLGAPGGATSTTNASSSGGGMSASSVGAGEGKSAGSAKMKDGWRKMMASSRKDHWKMIVIKATSRELAAPDFKHVQVLMEGLTHGRGDIMDRNSATGAICHHLRKRLLERDWIVATKTLTIFHHILRECTDEQLVRALSSQYRSVFDMSGFQNELPDGFAYVSFVRSYGTHLTAWGVLKSRLDYPPCKTGVWADKPESEFGETLARTEPKVLVNALGIFLDFLAQMSKLELNGPIRSSQVGTAAIGLIVRDFEHTWLSTQRGFIVLVDAFFGPSPDAVAPRGSAAAKKLHALYSRFIGEAAKQVAELVAKLSQVKAGWTPPATEQPDEYAVRDILDAMDAHARPGAAGAVGRVAPVVQASDMYGESHARGAGGRSGSAGGGAGFFGGDEDPFAPVGDKKRSGKKSGSRDKRGDLDGELSRGALASSDPFGAVSDGLDSLLLAPPPLPGGLKEKSSALADERDPFADPAEMGVSEQHQQLALSTQQQHHQQANLQMMQQQQYMQAMMARQQQQQRQMMQMQMMRQQQMFQQQQQQQQQLLLQQQQQRMQPGAVARTRGPAASSYNAAAYGRHGGASYNAGAYGNHDGYY